MSAAIDAAPRGTSHARHQVTLAVDARLWNWLRSAGDPAAVVGKLVTRAWRADVMSRARRAERAIEILIRRHLKELRRQQGAAPLALPKLRELAENEILRACEDMDEPAMQAAADRMRLQLMIQRAQVEDVRAARAELQRLRALELPVEQHEWTERAS